MNDKDKILSARSINLSFYLGLLIILVLTVKVYFTLVIPYEPQKSIRVTNSEGENEAIVKNVFTEIEPAQFDYYEAINGIKPNPDIIINASMELMKKGNVEEAFYLLRSHPGCENIAHKLSQKALSKVMILLQQGLQKEYLDFINFWKSISPASRMAVWQGKSASDKSRTLSSYLAKNKELKSWSEVKPLLPPLLLNVYLIRTYKKIESNDSAIRTLSKIFIKNELFQKPSYQNLFEYGLENNFNSYKKSVDLLNQYLEERVCKPLFMSILNSETEKYERNQFYLDSYTNLGEVYLSTIRSGSTLALSPYEKWTEMPDELKFFWRKYFFIECSKEFEIPNIVWERNYFLRLPEVSLNSAQTVKFIRSFPIFQESLDSFNYSLTEKNIHVIEKFLKAPLSKHITRSIANDIEKERKLLLSFNWDRYKAALRLPMDIEEVLSTPQIFSKKDRIKLAKTFYTKLKLFQKKYPGEQAATVTSLIAIIAKNRNLERTE